MTAFRQISASLGEAGALKSPLWWLQSKEEPAEKQKNTQKMARKRGTMEKTNSMATGAMRLKRQKSK